MSPTMSALLRKLRVAGVITCAATAAACYPWVERDPDPQTALRALPATNKSVRLTLTDGGRLEMERPLILADSVVQRPQYPDMRALSTPRETISKVETRRFSAGRTTMAVILSAFAYPVLRTAWVLMWSAR